MENNILEFLEKNTGINKDQYTLNKLFGQASARQYFRAETPERAPFVVMYLPDGFSSPAEEITKVGADAPKELPFINVQKYLKNIGVLVPEIIALDENHGFILLEDLGDQSLEKIVAGIDTDYFTVYYKKVIESLVDLQMKTQASPPNDTIIVHRHFDHDLLNWEFYHFLEYAVEDRFQLKVSEDEDIEFKRIANSITEVITQMPQGFVHRDFQSRNIMFKNFNFYLIDFQDALMGPVLYDLVALLRDSYINITPKMLDGFLSYYASLLPEGHPYYEQKENIKNHFHFIALQRKMKDTGRFQYIKTVRGNPNFLKNVPQSLSYVNESLDVLSQSDDWKNDIQALRTFINKYIPKEN